MVKTYRDLEHVVTDVGVVYLLYSDVSIYYLVKYKILYFDYFYNFLI